MSVLHITNGDSTVGLLKAANIEGDMLPWRDILHMGPVPVTDTLAELSKIRASFLASLGWTDEEPIQDDFKRRDNKLALAGNYDKVLLWFEHDLYDQLQLLQLLDWFNQDSKLATKLWLINPNKHLGYHTVDEVPDLLSQQAPVTQQQITLAKDLWLAFRQPTPEALFQSLDRDMTALPYLKAALHRTLAELPSPDTGFNQTEMMMLNLIADNDDKGGLTKIDIFKRYNQVEEASFHGDMGFFWYLVQLLQDAPELLIVNEDKILLTEKGKDLLTSKSFWHRKYSRQHWLGGYALSKEHTYYWNAEKKQLSHR